MPNEAESRAYFKYRNSLITLGLNSTHVKLISDQTDIAVFVDPFSLSLD